MTRILPAVASGTLAGALLLATFALPAAAEPATVATEFSAQLERAPGGRRGGPPPGAGAHRHMGGQGGAQRQFGGQGGARFGGPAQHRNRQHFGGPRGPHVGAPGFRGPAVGFRGPGYRGPGFHRGHALIRGRHHVRRGGLLLPLVGLGALGAIYVGQRYYTPYAYIDGPVGPECSGPTEDGVCELRMTQVPLEGGGTELQCVAYCPQ